MSFRKTLTRVVAVVAVVLTVGVAQADTIYDFSDSFNTTYASNSSPYGVWSYVTYDTSNPVPSTATSMTYQHQDPTYNYLFGWALDSTTTPGVMYNGSSSDILHASVMWLAETPILSGPRGPAVLRWTAPGAGTVDVSATFDAVTDAWHIYSSSYPGRRPNTQVFLNNTLVDPMTALTSYRATHAYAGILTVAAGDTLDFVGRGATVTDASTGSIVIYGTIAFTPIPEPSTLALLATGLVGLLCYAWRKRR